MRTRPRAILFDLDDTLIQSQAGQEDTWLWAAQDLADALGPLPPAKVADAILEQARIFWSDSQRHKIWRMKIGAAQREIVALAFQQLAKEGLIVPGDATSNNLADRASVHRENILSLFPESIDVLGTLKSQGMKMALITNGAAQTQRAKIDQFDLAKWFDHLQIEGEVGFGKPEERAYRHALEALGVTPGETWMVGDNLEWEVLAPQRLGIFSVWRDVENKAHLLTPPNKPDLIVRSLTDLIDSLPR